MRARGVDKKVKSANNIWDKEGFRMCGIGEKSRLVGLTKHLTSCMCWSIQRITRGYADCDIWNMFGYLQNLIPEMLQYLKDNRYGSPAYLGEDYTDERGILVNDTCHEEWDKILDRMIFLWKESKEDTCSRKNPYDEAYYKAHNEFTERYGIFGEKLQTEEELEKNERHGGFKTVHFMNELPEYSEIWDKHLTERRKLEEYRCRCKDEAVDMLKEYFYSLWD